MRPPSILGFRLADQLPPPGVEGTVATLTVEYGPFILMGVRLCRKAGGLPYLKPPYVKNEGDRLVMRAGPERDALLVEAVTLLRGFLEARAAATPLATAPGLEHSPP